MKAGVVVRSGIVALVIAAGCGGVGDGVDAAPVDTARVTMPPHYRFDPPAVRVSVGTAVTWRNTDDFTHAVRIDTAGARTHTVRPGDSLRLEFDHAGEYPYVCSLHPHDMRGKVVVVPGGPEPGSAATRSGTE